MQSLNLLHFFLFLKDLKRYYRLRKNNFKIEFWDANITRAYIQIVVTSVASGATCHFDQTDEARTDKTHRHKYTQTLTYEHADTSM